MNNSYLLTEDKDIILNKYCTQDIINELQSLVRTGSVFLVISGDYSSLGKFYKGLMQLMKVPTYNGSTCYDAYYRFKHAYERPVTLISLDNSGMLDNFCNITTLSNGRYAYS